jgi:flagellar hook-associated protein 3 FlgL
MRVSFNSFPDSFISQLASLKSQQAQLQNQVATGKRVSQLDDDPAAMAQVLDAQTQNNQLNQYQQNIASLQTTATASYNAISGLQTLSSRAGEIATLASDGTKSQQDLNNYATEVNQLIQQGVTLMNSQSNGGYLFGGTASSAAPFTAATDSSGNVTGVTYNGNSTVPSVEVASGLTVSAQVPGVNTSGTGPAGIITDSGTGADFFNHLIDLRNNLQSGNTSAITSTDSAALTKDEDNITLQMGTNGLVQSQLTNAASLATAQSSALTQTVSQDSDADLATTMTELSSAQTAYEAALQSGGSILSKNISLLDYIS